jgi:hypothetical protein
MDMLDAIVPTAAANPLRRASPAARHSGDACSTYSWCGASPQSRDDAPSPPAVYVRTRTPSKTCLRDSTRDSCRGSIRGGTSSAMFASTASADSSASAAGFDSPSGGLRRASLNGVGRAPSVGDAHATHRALQLLQFAVAAGSRFVAVASEEEATLRGDAPSQLSHGGSGGSQLASPSSPGVSECRLSSGLHTHQHRDSNQLHDGDPLHDDDPKSLDSCGDTAGAANVPSGTLMAPSLRGSGGLGRGRSAVLGDHPDAPPSSTGLVRLIAVTPAVDRSVELNRAVQAKYKVNLLAAKRASPPQQASSALVPLTGFAPLTAVTPAVDRGVELNRAGHTKFKGNLLAAKR